MTNIRIGQYNIRVARATYTGEDKGQNAWPNRQSTVAANIKRSGAPVFGIQEASNNYDGKKSDQAKELLLTLNGGSSGNWTQLRSPRQKTIIWRKDLVTASGQSGELNLTSTSDGGQRSVQWQQFTENSSGDQFILMNVHLDNLHNGTRLTQAKQVAAKAKSLHSSTKIPIILVGDFNSYGSDLADTFTKAGFTRTLKSAKTVVGGQLNSWQGFKASMSGYKYGHWIDQQFTYGTTITASSYINDLPYKNGKSLPLKTPLGSDHNMLYADYVITMPKTDPSTYAPEPYSLAPSLGLGEFDMGIFAYTPGKVFKGFLGDATGITVAYPMDDIPTLQFTYPKDGMNAQLLQQGVELVVAYQDPRNNPDNSKPWVEPRNSRFIPISWQDDVVDDTNMVTYTCNGLLWLLKKVAVRRDTNNNNSALFNKAAAAKKKLADMDRVVKRAEAPVAKKIAADAKAFHLKGGTKLSDSDFPAKAKTDCLLYVHRKGRYYRWNGGKWVYQSGSRATAANQLKALYNVYYDKKLWYKRAADKKQPIINAAEQVKNGKRVIFGATPGLIMKQFINEARSHGDYLPGVDRDFDGTNGSGRDSKGKKRKWTKKWTYSCDVGTSLYDVLSTLQEQGYCGFNFDRRWLQVWRPGDNEVNAVKRIAFHLGQDLSESTDVGTREDMANTAVTVYKDGQQVIQSSGKNGPWGRWDTSISASDSNTASAARRKGAKGLANKQKIRYSSTVGLVIRNMSQLPVLDYGPGYLVQRYSADGTMDYIRIKQLTLTRDEKGMITGSLTFNDRFLPSPLNFSKSINKSLGGMDATMGTGKIEQAAITAAKTPVVAPTQFTLTAVPQINEQTGLTENVATINFSHDLAPEPALDPSAEPSDSDPGEVY